MNQDEWLAERFEEHRGRLRGVAYRMLGSLSEADDAVQEAWLRLSRSDASAVENLGGWLTTVVARISLDMLRSRTSRREESLGAHTVEPTAKNDRRSDPENEALLADSVGLALLVVLDRLAPAERLAFVLHDMFAISFDEIASIVGRSPTATRQLASRARRRVRGVSSVPEGDISEQRAVVEIFLSALRSGDVDALLKVLDPDVVVRVDGAAAAAGKPAEVRGAENWARQAVAFSRQIRFVQPALLNGAVGLVWAPRGKLHRALSLTFAQGKIARIDVIADPDRLSELNLAALTGQ